MSFYGNVVYEFKKMFSKLKVTKSNTAETPITPSTGPDVTLEASNMWEQIDLKPSNRWIQLDCVNENDKTKMVTIGHGGPGAGGNEMKSVELVVPASPEKANAVTPSQLKSGAILKTIKTKYDQAGHLVGASTAYDNYKLPVPTISLPSGDNITPIAETDKINFQNGNWITLSKDNNALKISHLATDDYEEDDFNSFQTIESIDALPGENTEYTALEPGDYIKTYNVTKDSTYGHIIKVEEAYFQLPMTDNDRDYTDAKNRLTFFEETLGINYEDEKERNEENEFYQYDTLVEEVNANNLFFNVIRSDESYEDITDLTGLVDDMYYQETEDGEDLKFKKSLAATIGKVDGADSIRSAIRTLLNKQDNEDPEVCYTVSEAIQKIVGEFSFRDSEIATLKMANKGFEVSIIELQNEIQALEDRIAALEAPQATPPEATE